LQEIHTSTAEQLTENFSREEFSCSNCNCIPSDLSPISPLLVAKLQSVRDSFGKPIHINSGIRCAEKNKEAGGTSFSSHLYGLAADIRCDNSVDRSALMLLLVRQFRRIGIGKDFIHCDVDSQKDQDVMWVYTE